MIFCPYRGFATDMPVEALAAETHHRASVHDIQAVAAATGTGCQAS